MPDHRLPVQWQVAMDDRFRHVVRAGVASADPARPVNHCLLVSEQPDNDRDWFVLALG
jgi:phosphodiesterase/alkaline phosphatase D-like protein